MRGPDTLSQLYSSSPQDKALEREAEFLLKSDQSRSAFQPPDCTADRLLPAKLSRPEHVTNRSVTC